MKKPVLVLALLAMAAMVAACGSSSSTPSDDVAEITTLAELPNATAPVTGASANIAAKDISKAATTGLVLSAMSSSDFSAGESQSACESAVKLRDLLSSAAMGDMILCYIKNMVPAYATAHPSIDIYDGAYHIFNLSVTGDEGAPDHIKMKIAKTGGVITNFEMFECQGGAQKGYISQTINGLDFDMLTKGTYSGGGSSGTYYAKVDGTLNTNGSFATKEVNNAYTQSGADSSTGYNEATLTQGTSTFLIDAYNKYISNFTYTGRSYASGQLIGSAANTYAMGDGAAIAIYNDGQGHEGGTTAEGWLGDTLAIDSTMTSTYTTQTPREAATSAPTLAAFSASETYACDGTPDSTDAVTGDQATIDAACVAFTALQSNSWINCYEAVLPDFTGTYSTTNTTCVGAPSTMTMAGSYPSYTVTGGNVSAVQFGNDGNCSPTMAAGITATTCTYTGTTGAAGSVVTIGVTSPQTCSLILTKQ